MSGPTIAFTGGGTGGHIYPGLAVIEALRTAGFTGRIVWIGSSKESDRRIVESAGIEYRSIPSGKLRRNLSLENIADAFRVAAGYFAARKILKELNPLFLFSKGGYVSVPPCAAAAALKIPYATHESDASPGLATRLNARKADFVLTSWPDTMGLFPEDLRHKVRAVGNPVRAAIRNGDAVRGRAFLGVPEGLPVLLFLGGSQGAAQVNSLAASVLPGLTGRAFVAHQTGRGNESEAASGTDSSRYRAFPYLDAEMPDVLAAADIVIGRAGAGTVWECAALGKPMVLIPLAGSGTRGDQVENARMAESAGAAKCLVGDNAASGVLLEAISGWLDDPEARAAAGRAAAGLGGVMSAGPAADAAAKAAALILERIGRIS
ncbi:MAG: undecaprenyldiphospho-muramoylpentapeptide beta-N-acetylglucosaminyltransferase [Rectinema sp.]